MDDKRIPSFLLTTLLAEVEERMGRRSLITLLRQTGLAEYVDNLPPRDASPAITVGQCGHLLADIHDLFGARAAQPIFVHSGRLAAAEFRRQRPAQFAVAGTALKLLPLATRMRIILERLAGQGEELCGTPHHLHEESEAFVVEMPSCPYCAEITRRAAAARKPVARPVCHMPLAAIDEMVEWVTGQKHLVEEVACIATGEPACCFRVAR